MQLVLTGALFFVLFVFFCLCVDEAHKWAKQALGVLNLLAILSLLTVVIGLLTIIW